MSLMTQKIDQTFKNSIKKESIIYFQWFRSYKFFFGLRLETPLFCEKDVIGQER
jgi:hypothetical protein